jgi:alpha-ketoglutarate-dependent taurine dioxygenase
MPQAQTQTRLQVRALSPALGGEVRGVDLRQPMDAATFEELHQVWRQCLVLVFPGQHVSDEEHVRFTRRFGDCEIFHQEIIKSKHVREIFRVSNVDEEGRHMGPDHPTVRQLAIAQSWHTDSSYRSIPCNGALLHGLEVSRSGGETEFANQYLVYEALPERLKRQVEGRKARHNFEYMHVLQPLLKPLAPAERAAMPSVWQPMVRIHPATRRKSLYISPIYNDEVEGMPPQEGRKLIAELAEFAGQPRFVYRHRWETDDVLLWDNRCTMHRVTPFDPRERRVMHRTTIVGDAAPIAA